MRVDVLTLFPEAFSGPLDVSIIGRAQRESLLSVHLHDIREHADDRHRSVDDNPFGGGQGMVMKVDVLDRALSHVRDLAEPSGLVVYVSPRGRRLDDSLVRELSIVERLIVVCGRYEGVDQRFVDHFVDEEVSIGDYVLTGGELPAMVLIDAVARHIPGALGDEASAEEESFAGGLLEYPQFTRPAVHREWSAPAVLLSGNHADIERWKAEQRIEQTRERRPDLLTPENALLPPKKRRKPLSAVTTRVGGPQDLDTALELLAECAPDSELTSTGQETRLRQWVEDGRLLTCLAEHRGRMVGAALVGFDGVRGRLHAIGTEPGRRRRGVAALLVRSVEESMRKAGCTHLEAGLPNDNFAGMALLDHCSWAPSDRRSFSKQIGG